MEKYIDTLFTKYGKNNLAFKNQIIPTNLNSFLINYFIKKLKQMLSKTH